MIKNLFKIAFRNLVKSKTFSLINILGLAFGLSCALLISLWVIDEYSIDNYHTKKDRIYSVVAGFESSAGWQYWNNTPGPLAEVLIKDVPGIEHAIRMTSPSQKLFKQEEQKLEEWGISADPEIFKVFDFPLAQGDANTALDAPSNVVISKKLADKLFPNTAALNKTITINDWGDDAPYLITGVLEEIPVNSTLQFEYILSYEAHLKKRSWSMKWDNYNDRTVILVEEQAQLSNISDQILDIIPKYSKAESADGKLFLYAFKDMYLKSNLSKGIDAEGRIVYVRIFSIIAIVILLIACINFMSLSTARAGKRAKEVGVRKATGATRKSLIWQFLGESVLIALISGALAITMSDLLLVFFNQLVDKSLEIPYGNVLFLFSTFGVCLLTGVLAGLYPAIYLSSFNPSKVLKSAVNDGKSLSGFRRVLVIVQFTMSITFVVTTMIVYSQLQFILHKDLGLNRENILYHDLNAIMGNREAYRNEILQIPGVKTMSNTDANPLDIGNTTSFVEWKGKEEGEEIYFHVLQTDQYFVETFGATLLDGKDFSNKYDTAALQVLINEEAVEVMFLEDPIGSRLKIWGGYEVEVVGLIKDFHHQSLEKNIDPIIVFFRPNQSWRNYIVIDGDVEQAIAEIGEVYAKFETNYPFDYGFLDVQYERTYAKVSMMGKLSNIFAIVTIFVSCLGLFGLASYMTEQRKKETGIRKVMGASVLGLITLFTRSILGLVMISFAFSAPFAWYLASRWLNDFAYKIDLGVTPFILGGVSAMIIAIATVSYHTIKVATANPIESLKYE
jgi:ABC-type antimicrobial peptide transport system permease subunit